MLRLNYFLSLILLMIFSVSIGQTNCEYTLSGTVLDEHNNEPLGFALIVIEGTVNVTTSDSLGIYTLKNVCAGTNIVHCDHMGCERIIDTINVQSNQNHNFHPEHHVNELGDVVFTIQRKEIETQQEKILSKEAIDQSTTQQLGEALKSIQGVQNQSSGTNVSKPSIHGMHSNRVLILNNEIRQEGQQWGTDHGVELDFTTTKNVHVISGANSLAYGSDAIGGVVILKPAPLRRRHGIEGKVFVGGESNGKKGVTGAEINGNFKAIPQLSYKLQGSLKKSGNVHTPDYFIDNTGIEEKNYSWAVGYKASNYGIQFDYSDFNAEYGVFSGAHIGNLTDLNNAFTAEQPNTANEFSYDIQRPYQSVSHEMIKAKSFFYINDSNKIELIYGRQFNQRSEYDSHSTEDEPDFNFNLTSHTVDAKFTHHGKWQHQYGIQGGFQGNTWSGRYFIPNYEKYAIGAYAIETIKKGKHLVDFGLRYDFNYLNVYYFENGSLLKPSHEFQNINGNIGYSYKISDSLSFHSNLGTAWRPPAVNELYSNGLHHGSAALEYGNQKLNLEQVINWNASLEKHWKKWDLKTQLYANYFSNYIYLAPTGETQLTIRGAFPVFEFKQVEATLNGIDLEVKYALHSKVDIEFGSSFIRANNLTNNNFLWGMPADEYNTSIQYKPNFGKMFQKTVFELNFQYVSQQDRFQAHEDYVDPPKGYGLLNFKAYTKLNFKTPLTLFFNVNNVLDVSYRSYLNRFRYFTDEMGINFTFGVKYNFEINENHHHHK